MTEEAEAEDRVVLGQEAKMSGASGSHGHDERGHRHKSSHNCHQNETKEEEAAQVSGGTPTSSSTSSSSSSSSDKTNTSNMNKGKSCKGCLYYSSTFKSNSRNPLCVGITRSLPHVPRYIVSESEMEASKEGRSLTDFRYACVGYSLYPDQKNRPSDGKETQLPVCVGLEILVDRRVRTAAHAHNKEDGTAMPQPRPHKPAHAVGDEFLTRFTRNANLVAMGVVKNMRKVGNRIKESVDDILYPYRRRPK